MSICIICKDGETIWVGGDTAVSFGFNGKCYRSKNPMSKIFQFANCVAFCGGSVRNGLALRDYFTTVQNVDDGTIDHIAAAVQDICSSDLGHGTTVLIATTDTGHIYGISETSNFIVQNPPHIENLCGFNPICFVGLNDSASGFAVQQAPILHQRGYTIPELYQEIYSEISCAEMGGKLELFQINIPTKEVLFHQFPLVEHGIEYIEDAFLTAPQMNLSGASSINWGSNAPVKKRYSTSETGPWHNSMQGGDFYCCEWDYATNAWALAYKFRGQDGKNGVDGSDANVPKYITQTKITKTTIESPTIEGGILSGGVVRVTGEIGTGGVPSELSVFDQHGHKYGYVRYDDTGAGTSDEARQRMFICTEAGKALKIQSGGDMSIAAGGKEGTGTIYFDSDVSFKNPPPVVAVFG